MNLAASFRGNFGVLSQCSSCCSLQFQPFVATSSLDFGKTGTSRKKKDLKLERFHILHLLLLFIREHFSTSLSAYSGGF